MPDPGDVDRRWRSFRLEAVVLKHSDWGEKDRLLGLFSRQLGRLRAIAKGVRKPGSRKAGHLEPFTRVNLLLARGREIPIVTQAETIDAFLPLHDDLLRTTYASYVIELIDRFTYEEGENRGLYRLLVNTLARLCQPIDLDLVVRYYEVRLLDFTGFRPQLFNCLSCGEQILPRDQFFSPHQGGVICPKCGLRMNDSRLNREHPISMQALKYLRHFQRSSFSEASRANPAPQVTREMETVMQLYLTHLLERKLNTPSFLRRVRLGVLADTSDTSEDGG